MKRLSLIIILASIASAPAMADECEALARAGQIKTYTQMAHCSDQIDMRNLGSHNADLVKLLSMKRRVIARDMDKGRISREEGYIQIQALVVQATSEAQRRQALSQAAQPQAPRSSVTYCLNGPATICF